MTECDSDDDDDDDDQWLSFLAVGITQLFPLYKFPLAAATAAV